MTQNVKLGFKENLHLYIDHTLLRADAKQGDFNALYNEALKYGFKTVCIPPFQVASAYEKLKDSSSLVCTVIGFPLGSQTTSTKVFETQKALNDGAHEIDMVANISKIKDGDFKYITDEVAAISKACGGKTLKVILETCLLSNEEIRLASKACLEAGATYIKTSTGFSTGGATTEVLKIMLEVAGDKMKVKASGGIKSYETAIEYLNLGVLRLGTSSGTQIVNHKSSTGDY